MARTAVLGLPRVGPDRELKSALEATGPGAPAPRSCARPPRALRAAAWTPGPRRRDRRAPRRRLHPLRPRARHGPGLLGAIPDRFGGPIADGLDGPTSRWRAAPPEHRAARDDQVVRHQLPLPRARARPRADASRSSGRWTSRSSEARRRSASRTRPVVLGPCRFLLPCRRALGARPLDAARAAAAGLRASCSTRCAGAGATEVQIDEPCLVARPHGAELDAFAARWRPAGRRVAGPRALPGDLLRRARRATLERVAAAAGSTSSTSTWCAAPAQLAPALARWPAARRGCRSAWSTAATSGAPTSTARSTGSTRRSAALGAERVTIAPSCSLLHVPYSAARETPARPRAAARGSPSPPRSSSELRALGRARRRRRRRATRCWPSRRARAARAPQLAARRTTRRCARAPGALAPTTTTAARRSAAARAGAARARSAAAAADHDDRLVPADRRRSARRGAACAPARLDAGDYERFLEAEIAARSCRQEGSASTCSCTASPSATTWSSTSASSCDGFAVHRRTAGCSPTARAACKPPILFGDVSRPRADDRALVAVRAVADRAADEGHADRAGDDPAVVVRARRPAAPRDLHPDRARDPRRGARPGARRRRRDPDRRGGAARGAAAAPRRPDGLPALGGRLLPAHRRAACDDDTQIHTHMCYSEFGEHHRARSPRWTPTCSRSRPRARAWSCSTPSRDFDYPNEIGPGVYDIHSPRVPTAEEIEGLLELAEERIGRERLWVNPDCGLKTRGWPESAPALANMVAAAERRARRRSPPEPGGRRHGRAET